MSIINRPLIGFDNDEEHHTALIERQNKNNKDKDTSKNLVSLPLGSTVMVQREDGGPWTHGTTEAKSDHNHHDRSYKICITKTGKIVTCNRQHMKPMQILTEQYLHYQLHKHIKTDLLENIHEHLNRQPHTSNIGSNTEKIQCNDNTTHGHRTPYQTKENLQNTEKENSKHSEHSDNSEKNNKRSKSPGKGHSDISKNGQENIIRTRYGRVVKNWTG